MTYLLKHQDFGYFRHIAQGKVVFTNQKLAMRFASRDVAEAFKRSQPILQNCDVEEN